MQRSNFSKVVLPLIVCCNLLVFPALALAADSSSQDLARLTELNQGYLESYYSGDVEFFDKVIAEDFREIAPDGTILNREQFLAKMARRAQGAPGSAEIEAGDLEIRIFGDTAVVNARSVISLPDGSVVTGGLYTDIYSRFDGEWLCVGAHLGGQP